MRFCNDIVDKGATYSSFKRRYSDQCVDKLDLAVTVRYKQEKEVSMSPKFDWTNEQSSTISEWWKHRIENLYADSNFDSAEALYKEFRLDDEWM